MDSSYFIYWLDTNCANASCNINVSDVTTKEKSVKRNNAKLKKLLKHLYKKWVVEADDACYYGTAEDGVNDFAKLFKELNDASKSKKA